MAIRQNITSKEEIRDLIVADIVLIIAFSMVFSGGLLRASNSTIFLHNFLYFIPIAALAVTFSFVLHELMHKFVAQHYGAIAGFRTSYNGLIITLLTGAFGFLLAIPGATIIYSSRFTKEQNGIVSLAGPLTNFAVFAVFLVLLLALNPPENSYIGDAIAVTIFISILLAFFNMLPISPLDGSKVLAWSRPIYFIVLGAIFLLIYQFNIIPLQFVLVMIIIALLFSSFYRFTL